MQVSALYVITQAYRDLGVLRQNETPSAFLAQDGLARLNQLIDSWGAMTQTMRFVSRQTFPIVSNQETYTIGPGGDIDIPQAPQSLYGAGLLLNGSAPQPVELVRGMLTDDGYQQISIKDLSNTLFTNLYYRPTYSAGLATIVLWPVPTDNTNSIVLYLRDMLAPFANLDTEFPIPYGYADALEYNLALRLARPNAVATASIPDIVDLASATLTTLKRSNVRITDLPLDPAWTHSRRGGYNINSGEGYN